MRSGLSLRVIALAMAMGLGGCGDLFTSSSQKETPSADRFSRHTEGMMLHPSEFAGIIAYARRGRNGQAQTFPAQRQKVEKIALQRFVPGGHPVQSARREPVAHIFAGRQVTFATLPTGQAVALPVRRPWLAYPSGGKRPVPEIRIRVAGKSRESKGNPIPPPALPQPTVISEPRVHAPREWYAHSRGGHSRGAHSRGAHSRGTRVFASARRVADAPNIPVPANTTSLRTASTYVETISKQAARLRKQAEHLVAVSRAAPRQERPEAGSRAGRPSALTVTGGHHGIVPNHEVPGPKVIEPVLRTSKSGRKPTASPVLLSPMLGHDSTKPSLRRPAEALEAKPHVVVKPTRPDKSLQRQQYAARRIPASLPSVSRSEATSGVPIKPASRKQDAPRKSRKAGVLARISADKPRAAKGTASNPLGLDGAAATPQSARTQSAAGPQGSAGSDPNKVDENNMRCFLSGLLIDLSKAICQDMGGNMVSIFAPLSPSGKTDESLREHSSAGPDDGTLSRDGPTLRQHADATGVGGTNLISRRIVGARAVDSPEASPGKSLVEAVAPVTFGAKPGTRTLSSIHAPPFSGKPFGREGGIEVKRCKYGRFLFGIDRKACLALGGAYGADAS